MAQKEKEQSPSIGGRLLHYAALLLALAATFYYIGTHRGDFNFAREFNWIYAPALLAAHFGYLLLYSLIFKMLIGKFGVKLKFHEYFGLSIVKNFTNYILPAHLGLAANSVYLKKKSGLAYAHFGAYFAAQSILVTASSAFYGLVGTYLVADFIADKRLLTFFYVFFAAVLAAIIILTSFTPRLKNPQGRVAKITARFLEGWNLIKSDRSLIFKILGFGFVGYCLATLTIKLGFAAFGVDIPLRAAFLAGVLGSFVNYVNLTPANLGVQEPFFALMAKVLGFGFNVGLLVSGINRVAQMIIVFSLAPFYSWYLTRHTPRAK